MKKLFHNIAIILVLICIITSCNYQIKDDITSLKNSNEAKYNPEKILKKVYTDQSLGEQLIMIFDKTQNTVSIQLNGRSYKLKKNEQLPEFIAENADYQYSDVRGEVTFLKKGYNIVLFYHKN